MNREIRVCSLFQLYQCAFSMWFSAFNARSMWAMRFDFGEVRMPDWDQEPLINAIQCGSMRYNVFIAICFSHVRVVQTRLVLL